MLFSGPLLVGTGFIWSRLIFSLALEHASFLYLPIAGRVLLLDALISAMQMQLSMNMFLLAPSRGEIEDLSITFWLLVDSSFGKRRIIYHGCEFGCVFALWSCENMPCYRSKQRLKHKCSLLNIVTSTLMFGMTCCLLKEYQRTNEKSEHFKIQSKAGKKILKDAVTFSY